MGDIIGGAGGANACDAGNGGFDPGESPGNKSMWLLCGGMWCVVADRV